MDNPTARQLCDATGISSSYAHMILTAERDPSRPLAIRIFRETGWRHSRIADLTSEQIDMLEAVEPWAPRQQAAA